MQKQDKSGKTEKSDNVQTGVSWLKYLGAIVAFLVVTTGVFWLMTVRIEQGYSTVIDDALGVVFEIDANTSDGDVGDVEIKADGSTDVDVDGSNGNGILKESQAAQDIYTMDEIVGIDCSEVTSIDSTIGTVSDEEENSDMDMLLNRRFQLQNKSKDNSSRKKSIYVEYAFHGTDENGFDYILFFAQQDIVNNTWSFSVNENFTDIYYPV